MRWITTTSVLQNYLIQEWSQESHLMEYFYSRDLIISTLMGSILKGGLVRVQFGIMKMINAWAQQRNTMSIDIICIPHASGMIILFTKYITKPNSRQNLAKINSHPIVFLILLAM